MNAIRKYCLLLLLAAGMCAWLLSLEGYAPLPATQANLAEPEEASSLEATRTQLDIRQVRVNPVTRTIVSPAPADSVEDDNSVEAFAKAVEQLDAAAVISHLQEISLEDLRGDKGRLFMRRWAELDPVAASQWALQLRDAEARAELSSATALAWSAQSLSDALDWVRGLSAGDTQNRLFTDLGYEVARVDPLESMKFAVELPAGESRDGLLLHALRQWAAGEPEQSKTWVLQLPPGPLREQALAAVATVLANQGGEVAARFAVEHVSPGPELDRAVIGIVQRWAQTDYAQTGDWVNQFPAGPFRENALAVFEAVSPK